MLDASAGISPALAIRYAMIAHGEDGCRISGRAGLRRDQRRCTSCLPGCYPPCYPTGTHLTAPGVTKGPKRPLRAGLCSTRSHQMHGASLIIRRSMVRVHPAPPLLTRAFVSGLGSLGPAAARFANGLPTPEPPERPERCFERSGRL